MAEFYIIAVGYDQESKCDLLNAMKRKQNSFTTFACKRNPVYTKVLDQTIHGHTISLVLTPSLNTPAWAKVRKNFQQKKEWLEKHRVFVYVRAESTNDDEKSLKSLEDAFPKEYVMGVDCLRVKNKKKVCWPVEDRELCIDERFPFKFQTNADWSTKASQSQGILEKIAEKVFKPKPISDQDEPSEVGAEKLEYSTEQQEGPLKRRETKELLSSVQVPELEYKPSIRKKLTKEDWDNFLQALRHGKARSNHVRVNVVGNHGVGKTTVINRLLMTKIQCPNPNPKPTENLEVHRVTARCTENYGKKTWETDENDMFVEELNIQRMAQAMKHTMREMKRSDSDCSSLYTQPDSMPYEDSEAAHQPTVITPGETPIKWNKEAEASEDGEAKNQASKHNLKLDLPDMPQNPTDSDDTNKSSDSLEFWKGSEEVIDESPVNNNNSHSNYFSPTHKSKSDLSVLKDKEDYLRKVLYCIDKNEKEKMYVSYWDYAGQSTYYATHQLFLSPSAVYLLVVDLRKDLTDKIDDNLDFRSGVLQSCTVADSIKFWALSVKAYTKDVHGGYAPFIVVGTHKGDIKDAETVKRKFNDIRVLLKTNAECIAIDNTLEPEEDDNLTLLRNKIIDVGLGVIDEQVSSQWINLEYDMQRSNACQDGYLKFSKLQELDKHLDLPMNSVGRLEAFLCHQHYRGHLLFYHHPELKELIITDPMILVDFLNFLFRRPSTGYSITVGWNEDGILNHSYIKDVAKRLKIEEFACMTLLKILVELHIVHPLSPGTTPGNEDGFFLPCMLKDKPTEDQTEPDEGDDCIQSPVFQIRFDQDSIYQTTFHQIVCALMKSMSVIEEDDTKQIYNLYACFDVENNELVWLVLYWKNSKIDFFIKVYKKDEKPMCQYVDDILDTLKDAIDEVLFANKHENVSYDFLVECPKHNQSFLSLTQLKKEECLCKGTPGKRGGRHAVKLQDIPEVMVDENKDQHQQDPTMLEKPSDTMLGRLAWKLASLRRETAATLAVRLKLPNAFTKADIITRDYGDQGSELFHILVTWRNHRETDRTYSFLLNRLTRTKDYDHSTLREAMFEPSITDPRFDSIPHDVNHGDKDIIIISDHLGQGYTFVLLELGVKWPDIAQERRNNRDDMCETIRQLLRQRRRDNPDFLTTRRILEAMKVMEVPLDPILTKLQK